MTPEVRLLVVAGIFAVALLIGVLWKFSSGRARLIRDGKQVDLAELGVVKNGKPVTEFGSRLTFLQFSSEVCSQCVQTARILGELETQSDDVLHIEVDITNRLDLASKYQVLQTPTTLILNRRGVVKSRIGGAPKTSTLETEIGSFQI
ncbi:MAG: thioredoxin [Microbacteriaceae bacterium]|nr:thioredoxin [Microbacteriaceae bacterium]